MVIRYRCTQSTQPQAGSKAKCKKQKKEVMLTKGRSSETDVKLGTNKR